MENRNHLNDCVKSSNPQVYLLIFLLPTYTVFLEDLSLPLSEKTFEEAIRVGQRSPQKSIEHHVVSECKHNDRQNTEVNGTRSHAGHSTPTSRLVRGIDEDRTQCGRFR